MDHVGTPKAHSTPTGRPSTWYTDKCRTLPPLSRASTKATFGVLPRKGPIVRRHKYCTTSDLNLGDHFRRSTAATRFELPILAKDTNKVVSRREHITLDVTVLAIFGEEEEEEEEEVVVVARALVPVALVRALTTVWRS